MFNEFKAFIARGNVLDLAVGVIIGAAFGKIVTSLTDDVIMPVISWLTGGMDFTQKFILLGEIPTGYEGERTYAALKEAGVAMLGYGSLITTIINFLLLAYVIFLIVRQANRMMPLPPPAAAGPSEVELLAEIRDALKK